MFEELSMGNARIVRITQLTPDVRQYVVRLEEGVFEGRAGQHTTIRKPEDDYGGMSAKSYSAVAVDGNELVLMIRTYDDGNVSAYMGDRAVGDGIVVSPTLTGSLTLETTDRPVVFLATGTGITPMIGMLQEYVTNGGEHATVMLGEKTTEHLMYKAMLEQMAVVHGVDVRFAVSRESLPRIHEGYIQECVPDQFASVDGTRDYYVCGVPKMVVNTTETLEQHGVPDTRIHTEGWEQSQVDNE